jgi:hypothetical protein
MGKELQKMNNKQKEPAKDKPVEKYQNRFQLPENKKSAKIGSFINQYAEDILESLQRKSDNA